MKKILYVLAAAFSLMNLTACMDDWDEPNTDNFIITSPTSVGEVNTTIGEIKDLYCAGKTGKIVNDYNYWTEITEDKVLEGVIVANDCGGNLYQTLLVRKIDESLSDVQNRDQAIILSIRHTWLTPYFPVGQRIKINLKGLYVGCNSGEAKIGQPYYTSSGNFRLGPALLDMCKTNIELVGKADPTPPSASPYYATQVGYALRPIARISTRLSSPLLSDVSKRWTPPIRTWQKLKAVQTISHPMYSSLFRRFSHQKPTPTKATA